jgi:hypothetical protein
MMLAQGENIFSFLFVLFYVSFFIAFSLFPVWFFIVLPSPPPPFFFTVGDDDLYKGFKFRFYREKYHIVTLAALSPNR